MMNIVSPNTITTMMINPTYQFHEWIKASDVMRLLTKGAVRGFDANNNLAGWEPVAKGGYPLSWRDQTVTPYEDGPYMRSGGRQLMEENPHIWPIPTIVIIRPQVKHLDINHNHVSPNSVKGIYDLYGGRCVWCSEKITLSEASRDHYYPTGKGGVNEVFNMVLSCKECNNKKGDQFPWFDNHGEEPRIRIPIRGIVEIPNGLEIREEWKQFLYHE
jgi:hypothetical protein